MSKRAVALVDETRTIRYAWEADDRLTDPDIDAVYDAVSGLESSHL